MSRAVALVRSYVSSWLINAGLLIAFGPGRGARAARVIDEAIHAERAYIEGTKF
ncbi:MAG: hypothetical protein AAGA90_23585 [Actinomycetota bacterium]